ncbi:3-carboxy-cis,cis-muconate cycloisomerase [Mycolicibacterium flavescens]|uniref:3-carboxy-cis,cis-muconate cycloisomerase n=1 Tax=Mycolicibacterium flavescens TaxID=1776 RepID=A0A1E3RI24_MYCFV|nr:lyase family protein [Mycolicibacterium flavescens]MCV7282238.1 3-carboxy-cis,cis-muconate cycloisomerase [Mycolicibacterium flavescens]ODQ89513.1 3-carboxy-cis,cis-muconate cycloisomerase [Mycolicibacterium flavescens]
MTDLFWPGDHLAGDLMSDGAFLEAMVAVEQAWLDALVRAGIAPPEARADLSGVLADGDLGAVARRSDVDGNPVSALVALLRERSDAATARWLHRGLTSQDVLDTALIVCARDALEKIADEGAEQVRTLTDLAEKHRATPTLARTLTQAALPTTLGARIAHWLDGVLDAAEPLAGLRSSLPVQAGGAAGTLAAATELAGSVDGAVALSDALAEHLHLAPALPWHTTRSAITRIGDAMVTCCDAWGHIASDVATASRPEIGEMCEGRGGGSSTMPHKNNPVRSVLIRRAAVTAGPLAATLHAASAASVDERSDGAWHAEWATLRTLTRHTVVAAVHTTELVSGLQIDEDRAAANLDAAPGLLSEQRDMTELTGRAALPEYSGAVDRLVGATLSRARRFVKESS